MKAAPFDGDKPAIQLSMLNGMAGSDFEIALQRHQNLGLLWLDLKDGLWGQTIDNLSLQNAHRAARLIEASSLGVACFSTSIGHSPIIEGERVFRERHEKTLAHVLEIAAILKPQRVRLLAPPLRPPESQRDYGWVFRFYQDFVDTVAGAGISVLIENEAENCWLSSVEAVQEFFEQINRPTVARFTWDVQNLWQTGTFPSLEVYRKLSPVVGALHLKGGKSEDGHKLKWASTLETASWPVLEIVRAAISEGVVSLVCLNPSHGERVAGFDGWEATQRDLAFLRQEIRQFNPQLMSHQS